MHEWPGPTGSETAGWVIPKSLQSPRPEAGTGTVAEYGQTTYHQPDYAAAEQPLQPPQYQQPVQPAGHYPAGPGQPYQQFSSYPASGPSVPAWMTAQPVKRRGKLRIVLVSALVLVLAASAGSYLFTKARDKLGLGSASGQHSLRLPGSAGGYLRLTTGTAAQLGTDMADQVKANSASIWTDPIVGIYGTKSTGVPNLIFIGGDAKTNPRIGSSLRAGSAKLVIDGFMAGAHLPSSTSFSAGHFGGVLRCGSMGVTATVCVWADQSTVGALLVINSPSLAEAAKQTVSFRDATEH